VPTPTESVSTARNDRRVIIVPVFLSWRKRRGSNPHVTFHLSRSRSTFQVTLSRSPARTPDTPASWQSERESGSSSLVGCEDREPNLDLLREMDVSVADQDIKFHGR